MYEIDRIVAIVKPREKMLQWLQTNTEESEEITLEDLRNDCTSLLLPPFDEPNDAMQFIKEHCEEIFENELISWDVEEQHWPTERNNFLSFSEWFDVEFHSLVFDMVEFGGEEEEESSEEEQTILQ